MSKNRTLIAYATRGGTTEAYAQAITSVLTDEFHMPVDVVNLRTARNLDVTPYRNIIVGAGIKMFRIHKEGAQFLERTDFGKKTVGIFLSSLVPRDEAIAKYVDVILQKNATLKPVAVDVFGGRMRMLGRTSEDKVDIDNAKAWTRTIVEHIQQ